MIKFPKMHIAASVLNRVANTLEEIGPLGMGSKAPVAPEMQEAPVVASTSALGLGINDKLAEPLAPVAVAPEMETDANNGMLQASAMGGSPFDGALLGASGT